MQVHTPPFLFHIYLVLSVKTYYPALTGIRAIAAYLVFFYHFSPERIDWGWLPKGSWTSRFLEEWHIGVPIFFVLSGFLITSRYQHYVQFTSAWWGRYIRNRVARIFPMYALLTLLTFAVFAWFPAWDKAGDLTGRTLLQRLFILFSNLTFLRGYFDDLKFTGLPQGWSLTVEECFYFTAPFLLVGLRRSTWRLVWYALLIGAIGLALLGIGRLVDGVHYVGAFGFMRTPMLLLNFTFFGRCVEFLAGIGLALYLQRHPVAQYHGSRFTLLGAAAVGVCAWLLMLTETPLDGANGTSSYAGIAVNNLLLPGGVVLLFYGLIAERSWFRALLETKLLELLGKSSYVFYLVHIGVFSTAISQYLTDSLAVKFVLLNLLSIALFRLVEEPLHRLLTRANRSPRPVAESIPGLMS